MSARYESRKARRIIFRPAPLAILQDAIQRFILRFRKPFDSIVRHGFAGGSFWEPFGSDRNSGFSARPRRWHGIDQLGRILRVFFGSNAQDRTHGISECTAGEVRLAPG